MASIPGAPPRPRMDPAEPGGGDGDRRNGLTAASLFLVLIGFWIVTRIEYVIILGLFALLLGTVLEGPVRRIQARRVPRPAAIFMVYAAIVGLLVLLVLLIIPVIADQADTFREDVPVKLLELENEWKASSNPLLSGTGATLIGNAREFLDNPDDNVGVDSDTVQNVIPVISGITTGIVGVITTLVVTFYYMMEKAFIRRLVIGQLDPRHQPRVDKIWQDVEDKVGGWMRGQLLLCLIIGSIATISYGALGIGFWPLLGLWAGMTEIIPIVGPWIGGVPAVIVALTQGWDKALLVGLVIIGMQTLENWFLVPRVMRGAVGLSPLTVFVAILAGTQFMGVTGAILAIPIAAAVQVILVDYFSARQVKRDTQRESGWRWMLNRTLREDGWPPSAHDDDLRGEEQTISGDVQIGAKRLEPSEPTAPPVTTPAGIQGKKTAATPAKPRWAPFADDDGNDAGKAGATGEGSDQG